MGAGVCEASSAEENGNSGGYCRSGELLSECEVHDRACAGAGWGKDALLIQCRAYLHIPSWVSSWGRPRLPNRGANGNSGFWLSDVLFCRILMSLDLASAFLTAVWELHSFRRSIRLDIFSPGGQFKFRPLGLADFSQRAARAFCLAKRSMFGCQRQLWGLHYSIGDGRKNQENLSPDSIVQRKPRQCILVS